MATLFVRDIFGNYAAAEPEAVLLEAKRVIARKFRRGRALTSPALAKEALIFELADREHEVFGMICLDNQHRIIESVELFRGTIDGASVFPREVVKTALDANAAAVMFYHNHPSGVAEPSQADQQITQRLKQAFALIEVRVLDHFIIGGTEAYSFSESGLL